ncbi:MAG: M23 family metallopeptidase [Parvibaculum sp.]|nr:M23 family metallopeptidase [Parvibaculum sp.]
MFDTGTRNRDADQTHAFDEAAVPSTNAKRLADLRVTIGRALKLYGSASRLVLGQSLGQRRWLVATGVAGALSFGLLAVGITTLVAPYSGVETAALSAEDTPQIIALNANAAEAQTIAAIAPVVQDTVSLASIAQDLRGSSDDIAPLAVAPATSPDHVAMSFAQAIGTDTSATPSDIPDNADLVTASIAPAVPEMPKTFSTSVEIDPGATLMQVLTEHGVDRVDAYHAIAALKPVFSPSKLKSGQEISLTFLSTPAAADSIDSTPSKLLTSISLQPDVESKIEVQRSDDGSYTTEEIKQELTKGYARAAGEINSSLFIDAAQAGVPVPIIIEMIRMFSYSVDFQREIHPGDTFEVYFDRKLDTTGAAVKSGDISYASLTILGKPHKLWRYKSADGTWDYFDESGRSMKKFLMKTPIDGARISSGFGKRKHPILGYTKLHSGVDFAAPRGTPIYAAGNGKVEVAGWQGGYGKYVRIQHANGYETAYGHMNGFAKGVRAGTSVRQGQIIGYVGTTGRSTGPHLHYEVIVRGKKTNPLGIKVPTGITLAGTDLKKYKATRSAVMAAMNEAPDLTKVAQAIMADATKKAN